MLLGMLALEFRGEPGAEALAAALERTADGYDKLTLFPGMVAAHSAAGTRHAAQLLRLAVAEFRQMRDSPR